MILIISDETDQSTCDVIDWLLYYNEAFIVITDKTPIKVRALSHLEGFVIECNNEKIIRSSEIKSVWYRRGAINLPSQQLLDYDDKTITQLFKTYNNLNNFGVIEYINYYLREIKSINNQFRSKVNKLIILKNANKVGLKTPATLITSYKNVLLEFLEKHKKIITKSLCEGLLLENKEYCFYGYTEIVTDDLISEYNDYFSPSLFQEYIPKLFEIRVFYFAKEFYSMAIFSQTNLKTTIDFRQYDKEKPNRCVPFKLPEKIEKKIIMLMEMIEMNCASLDFIYGIDKKFYFLEINPVGQFGMTSYPCNYFLERRIAEFLKE